MSKLRAHRVLLPRGILVGLWKGGRVVKGTGLENRRRATYRGFNSLQPYQLLRAEVVLGYQRLDHVQWEQ